MKKVAIVGVEGSGKTVMLSCLGELYSHPDVNGYFLSPVDFRTTSYVNRQIARMRAGEWPSATSEDEMQSLEWILSKANEGSRPKDIVRISFLDFAGEVYRCAFGCSSASHPELDGQVKALKDFLRTADEVMVLVNPRDIIVKGVLDERTEEAMWISNAILDVALDEEDGKRKVPRASIVLSQSDSYEATIEAAGGPLGLLKQYLPHLANRYGWLDVFTSSAVDRTVLDENGIEVPAKDFSPKGVQSVMDWVLRIVPGNTIVQPKAVEKASGASGDIIALPKVEGNAGEVSCNTVVQPVIAEMAKGKDAAFAALAECMVAIPGKNYKMCKYEVPQCLWKVVMGNNPSHFKGDDLPVENVSREDCLAFIVKLNVMTGCNYRLPTEEEWEYACRAGSTARYYRFPGDAVLYGMLYDGTEGELEDMGWYDGNSGGKTHPVGQKQPNAYGLYDMNGNVWEWTSSQVYKYGWDRDGTCGGAWNSGADLCGFSDCNSRKCDHCADDLGFRLVCSCSNLSSLSPSCRKEVDALAKAMVVIPGRNYRMCKYEVTQALWEAVMGNNPSWFKGVPNLPVENVSWDDCQNFIKKLNEMTGGTYRLPWGGEWEYACSGGSTGKYGLLADGTEGKLDDMGWYGANSGCMPHPVGQKKPNAYGLYDMHGNVWEWTLDFDYLRRYASFGGSWYRKASDCVSASRVYRHTFYKDAYLGFRLVSL